MRVESFVVLLLEPPIDVRQLGFYRGKLPLKGGIIRLEVLGGDLTDELSQVNAAVTGKSKENFRFLIRTPKHQSVVVGGKIFNVGNRVHAIGAIGVKEGGENLPQAHPEFRNRLDFADPFVEVFFPAGNNISRFGGERFPLFLLFLCQRGRRFGDFNSVGRKRLRSWRTRRL